MSSRDNNNNSDVVDFLRLLTITSYEQRLSILERITKKQCTIIRHLAYNLMFNESIEITGKDRSYLKRHTKSIKELASKKTCAGRRKEILVAKHLLVIRLAKLALKYLQ